VRDQRNKPLRCWIIRGCPTTDLSLARNREHCDRPQTCETWAAAYPREKAPHGFRGGLIYPVLGKFEEAIEEAKQAIRLDADFPVGYSMLSENYIDLDDLQGAEKTLQLASARGVDSPDFVVLRYDLAFLRGDRAEMERQAALIRSDGCGRTLSGVDTVVLQALAQLNAQRHRLVRWVRASIGLLGTSYASNQAIDGGGVLLPPFSAS
jgi:hypothetical protein